LKNLAILLSFDKFDRSYMQSRLLAVAAPGGEKARQMERSPRTCRLQPLCRRTQGNRLDFTLDTPWATRFELF
jgi:hypothetical protein